MFARRGSRFVPGRATLWWLGISVAVGLIGWTKAINLLLILGFVLLGLLLCQAIAARVTARRVRLVPKPSPTIFAGGAATVAFEISNQAFLPSTFRIDGPLDLSWLFPQVPGTATVRGSGEVVLTERGVQSLGHFRVVSAYPFGVLEYRCESEHVPDVYVLPALGSIHERQFRQWLRITGSGDSRQARAVNRRWNADGDVRGIRPYRTGDNPKDIHWKSTARRGTLYVREYDSTPPKDLVILIDAYAPASNSRFPPLEIALSLAATLAWEWSRWDGNSTARILILGSTEPIRVVPGHPESLRALAEISGSPEGGGQPWLPHAKIIRHSHRVFISSRSGESPWLATLATAGFAVSAADTQPAWYRPGI